MTQRRVVLGTFNDGVTQGVRIALPDGVTDALTGNSDLADGFSFDSTWTDIAQIAQLGIGTGNVPFINPGYIPFVEARWLSGSVIYDDYIVLASSAFSGSRIRVTPGNVGLPTTVSMLYIIYKIPVPSG